MYTGAGRLSVVGLTVVGPTGITESRLSADNGAGECLLADLQVGLGGVVSADAGTITVSGTIVNLGTIQATAGGLFEATTGLDNDGELYAGGAGDLRTGTGFGLTMQPATLLTVENNGSTVDVGADMVHDGTLIVRDYGGLTVAGSIDAGVSDWSEGTFQDATVNVGGQLRLGIGHNAHYETVRSEITVNSLVAVGHGSTSTLDMRGGELIARYLRVGYNVGSDGVLILSAEGIFNPWVGFTDPADAFVVGYAGSGAVTQLDGTVTRENSDIGYPELAVGGSEGGKGIYNLHGGAMHLSNFRLGMNGEGTFTQTGGDVTVHDTLNFGQQMAGRGFYHLRGGTLTVDAITNGAGDGQLNVDGGALTLTGPSASVKELNVGLETGSVGIPNMGYKENGSVYSHCNAWAACAEAALGRGDLAFETFMAYQPISMNDRAEIREIEPYVHCAQVQAAPFYKPGRARNPWVTGSITWTWLAATQYILGIRAGYLGLRIDPCIPSKWERFEVTRRFRGGVYHIEVANPDSLCKGVHRLVVNGEELDGDVAPLPKRPGEEIYVTAVLEDD